MNIEHCILILKELGISSFKINLTFLDLFTLRWQLFIKLILYYTAYCVKIVAGDGLVLWHHHINSYNVNQHLIMIPGLGPLLLTWKNFNPSMDK